MANTNITTAQASGMIPEIWLGMALNYLRNYITIGRTVTTDTDLEAGAFTVGATLHIPKTGALSVNDKVENSNYTVQNPQSSTVDITLDKHKEVTFGVESRAISTANQNLIAPYVQQAAAKLAEQIDLDLFSLYSTIPSGQTTTATGAGGILQGLDLITARQILVQNKIMVPEKRFAVCDPGSIGALMGDLKNTGYINLGQAGDIADGKIGGTEDDFYSSVGRLFGFSLGESQLLYEATAASGVVSNLAYTKDAIVLANRALELPDPSTGVIATVMSDPVSGLTMRLLHSYNHLQGGHIVTLDMLYGFGFLRPEHIIRIKANTSTVAGDSTP